MPTFFIIALSIWFGAHFYLGWRFIKPAKLEHPWKGVAWASIFLLGATVPLVFWLGRQLDRPEWTDSIFWIAYVHMGLLCLVFFMTLGRDLVVGLMNLFGRSERRQIKKVAVEGVPKEHGGVDPSRRAFLTNATNAGILGVGGTLSAVGYVNARREPAVVEVDIPVKGLPGALEGFKVVQISDVHVGPTVRRPFVQTVVDRINTLDADMVAVTGDLIDGDVRERWDDLQPLKDIASKHGTFYVTGNHEYYWGGQRCIDAVKRLGMKVLLNEHQVVEHDQERVVVAGVTDLQQGGNIPGQDSDPAAAIKGAPEAGFKLLLAHQPRSVFAAAGQGYDLQISGHTHGGQFAPWSFFVWLAQPFTAGLHIFKDTMIYVSRGTGYWGPPMRLAAPSEITLLKLRAA